MHPARVVLPLIVAAAVSSAGNPPSLNGGHFIQRDVVIVGGGSSGTYAAIRLQEEGQSVVVLEKQDRLGGHTVTYTDPDTSLPFNLGVFVYHDSPIVRDYFGKLGVALRKQTPGENVQQAFYDFSTGGTVDGYEPVSRGALGAAMQKYLKITEEKYPYLKLGYDMPDPVPEELLAPYSDFIKANGLKDIVQQVSFYSSCNGNLSTRPALYGIKGFGPLLVQAIEAGLVNAASGDNQDLYRAAQSRLAQNHSVILQSNIRKVKRSADSVYVWADTHQGNVLIKAKKLVLAIPPTLTNLQRIGLDTTPGEEQLFRKINGFLYGSTVFTHPGINATTFLNNIGANTPYNLPKIPGSYLMSSLASGNTTTNKISAYFGGLDPSMTEAEVKEMIRGELDNLARDGNIGDGEPEFTFFENHTPHHLHVSADDIREGFYRKTQALQGERSTFWTGAAWVDNDSALIWTWTESYLLKRILDSLRG
ncbi:hypothetical protein ED733_005708 [Metarhizium rileyi]|uniref:Amine oxidase domain-containing protein n=1 Tax=Metarhizium rileyi (strain RCEF 4871) TaxID=1649241 RepID=A0A5C6GLA3_METRR|nr:hypothetical protein ED733_005708 [Metarhizium rileyi]